MTLHLQKLCVGVDSFEDLAGWIEETLAIQALRGQPAEQIHTTRMMPSRTEEVLDGGSLYWVIKGVMCARQRILALRAVTDSNGISRCQIVLEPELVRTEPRPRRPFQGWRYLKPEEAPGDMRDATAETGLPPHLVTELKELGLL